METFFTGTHQPQWLGRTDAPLFVSVRRLMRMKKLPRARGRWSMDSAGFTELSLHGRWTITVDEYIAEVRRCVACVGNMQWAAQQDMMAEPFIREKTGLTVEEHQKRTVDNFLELKAKAPEVPWVPVLQGWTIGEYWDCVERFDRAGVRLKDEPLVGLGSVCRRQSTTRIGALVHTLRHVDGLRLHTFGAKLRGLALFADDVVSSDSLAWSYNARRHPPLPECSHASCANCLRWALRWRAKVLALLGQRPEPPREEGPVQRTLF